MTRFQIKCLRLGGKTWLTVDLTQYCVTTLQPGTEFENARIFAT